MNNALKNIVIAILVIALVVVIVALVKKPKTIINNAGSSAKVVQQNVAASQKTLVCEAFELETETCVLPGAKFPIGTGEAVYDQGEYYGFYQDRKIEASVHIYKTSAFNCGDAENVISCDERTKTTLVKNDDTSKVSFARITKYLADADYQLNGGHQY